MSDPRAVLIARGILYRHGGESHSGWLPPGAAVPSPTPVREFILDIFIWREGDESFILEWVSRDGAFRGDTWHQSLQEAKEAALEDFGVYEDLWGPPE